MERDSERSPSGLLFEKLLKEKRGKVYSIAYGFFRNADDAKDLTQEVFKKAWENLGSLKDETKAESWLVSIAYNLCRNHKRKRRILEEEIREDIPACEKDSAIGERVREELSNLDDEKRMAMILLEYEGYSYREIASVMKKSEGAVKSIVFRAREELKERLKDLVSRRINEAR